MSVRKLLRAACLIAVTVLLAGISISCGLKDESRNTLPGPALENVSEMDSTLSVFLYGNESESDYGILQDTLRHAFSRKEYRIEKQQDGILLQFQKESVSEDQFQTFLEYFIVEPGRWNLTCDGSDGTFAALHTVAKCTPAVCKDLSILPAPQEEGSGSAAGDTPFLDFEMDAVGSIRLRFCDSVSGKLQDTIKSGSSVYLCRNILFEEYKNSITREGWELRPDTDSPDTFYIDYTASDELNGNEKLFQYLMTHEALSRPYNYIIVSEVSWEQPEETAFCGEMQRAESEIAAPYYQIYSSSWEKLSSEIQESLDFQFKERLDRLQVPYAFGHTADGDVCIRMQSDLLNASCISLLLDDYNLSLSIPGVDDSVRLEYSNIQYRADPPSITVSLSSDLSRRLQKALTAGQTTDGQDAPSVYLCADQPLAVCTPSLPLANNTLTFTETIFPDFSTVTSNYSWLAELLNEKSRAQYRYYNYILDHFYYYDSERYSWNDPSCFKRKEKGLISVKEAEQSIRKFAPDAEVNLSEYKNMVNVHLHLKADPDLVKKIFEMTPAILEAVSLENQYYSTLRIYPCEPSDDERAWIDIDRDMQDGLDPQDNAAGTPVPLHFSGLFFNGRFDKYKEEILERMEKDTFFSSMIRDDYGDGWILRSDYKSSS